jgi:hypothetical protein
MTTALWSGKHGVLAADNHSGSWMNVGKVFELPEGCYLTGAGYMDDMFEVALWLKDGGKENKKPTLADRGEDNKDTDFIYVEADGTAYWLTSPWLRKVPILNTFYAIGTGDKLALAALEAGATPAMAMKIAAKYDPDTGPKATLVKFPIKK